MSYLLRKSQLFGALVVVLLICIGNISADKKQLYVIKFSKPFSLDETGEIINPDTPEESFVVTGKRSLIYVAPTKSRVDYAVNEMNSYVADKNGYRVKLKFKLVRLETGPEEKLGPKALMAASG